MADVKITGLPELAATPDDADILEIVDDVAGTPTSKKITVANLHNLLAPKATPTFTGQVTIPTINLTGGQIAFPATAVPSADPNTLDDYEEGTWTPDIHFGGNKVGITYDVQVGGYTKIGNIIVHICNIIMTSKGSSVGTATLVDLPFVCGTKIWVVPISFRNITFANMLTSIKHTGDTIVYFYETTEAGVITNLTNADFANNTRFELSGTYAI